MICLCSKFVLIGAFYLHLEIMKEVNVHILGAKLHAVITIIWSKGKIRVLFIFNVLQ